VKEIDSSIQNVERKKERVSSLTKSTNSNKINENTKTFVNKESKTNNSDFHEENLNFKNIFKDFKLKDVESNILFEDEKKTSPTLKTRKPDSKSKDFSQRNNMNSIMKTPFNEENSQKFIEIENQEQSQSKNKEKLIKNQIESMNNVLIEKKSLPKRKHNIFIDEEEVFLKIISLKLKY